MDARAKMVRDILHSADQYLVPFFQRHYAWTQKHWERLYHDVITLQEDDIKSQHFLGPLVCTPSMHVPGEVTPYQLIDGQQRLTTLILMLAAIRDLAKTRELNDLAEQIGEDYLIHKRQKGLQRLKVLPRLGDREAFVAVIEGKHIEEYEDYNIVKAWKYYRDNMSGYVLDAPEAKLRNLFHTITARLSLVVITIDGENPYEIFESLNSTGLPLQESDLIRNYIFMQVRLQEQEEFHLAYWQPFENMFGETEDDPELSQTAFYRSYLMRDGSYSKDKATFQDFKSQSKESKLSPQQQVEELKRFAKYELWIRRPNTSPTPELSQSLEMVRALDISTANPIILHLIELNQNSKLSSEDLIGCLWDLGSFVLRRTICGESTRPYGRWFPEAIKSIKSNPRVDLQAYWLKRGWPEDKLFGQRLQEFEIYKRENKKCRLILETLERSHGHREKVQLEGLQIEHVMPQSISNGRHGKAWMSMLGDKWEEVHKKWLHTLGNLTLTGYNQVLSKKMFSEKKPELANSNLVLNRHFSKHSNWGSEEILARAAFLAVQVIATWNRPVDGPAYVPSADPEVNELDAVEKRDMSQEYWTEFLKLLEARRLFNELPTPSKLGFLCFRVGWRGARLFTFMEKGNRRIGVYIRLNKHRAKHTITAIEAQRPQIDAQFANELKWTNERRDKQSYVTLYLPGVDPLNRGQWRNQHDWLAAKVEDFFNCFDPFMTH